jgi:hypothetical protein
LGLEPRKYLGICWGCQKPNGRIDEKNEKKKQRMTWT